MTTKTKQTPEGFFYDQAGYGYQPDQETKEEERRRCARQLAEAERVASEAGFSYEWEIDLSGDSSEFNDDPEPWALWCCVCRDMDGAFMASLYGIDFGRDGEPWGQPYRRVVEAELALEATLT